MSARVPTKTKLFKMQMVMLHDFLDLFLNPNLHIPVSCVDTI